MEGLKAKTNGLRQKIDQAEERERIATKKLALACDEAEKVEDQVNALKRRKQLLEQKLEDVEGRCFEEEEIYRNELARKEKEDRQRKILGELEEEDERRMEKLEASIKQYEKAADYNENKCEECWRRCQTLQNETERFRVRERSAKEKRRELQEQTKFVGRNLRKLAISEEKRSDREEAYENKIRELWQLTRDQEIRREAADRKIGIMKREVARLQEMLASEEQNISEVTCILDETRRGLDGF